MIKSFAIMKKMYRFLFAVAVAATAFVGCVREPEVLPVAEEHPIHFVAQSIETRTAFSEPTGNSYPTLWTANDTKVKVSLNMVDKQTKDAVVTPSADFKTATFSAKFADTTVWNFFALSPASAYLSVAETVEGVKKYRLGVTVPTAQTPTATSVDEAAQILVAQSMGTGSTPPESVSFDFHHWTAYGKFSLSNLALNDAVIEGVDLTAAEDWAGRWYYFFSDGASSVNSGSNTISINTSSSSDIWFACAPVDLANKTLSVTVRTDKGTISKTFTLPSDKGRFESGKIARFTLNMSGATLQESTVFQLVSNASEMAEDDWVIIAAAANDFAISTTQNSSNIAATAVVKKGDKIVDPSTAVEFFKVEVGTTEGTYSFKTASGSGYLYAASSATSGSLKTKNEKDEKGSWTITFGEKTVMKAGLSGDDPRNVLQFNLNSGNPLFNCYNSNSASRDSVALYKFVSGQEPIEKQDPGLRIEHTSLSVAVGESKEIGIQAIASGYDGTITYTSSDVTIATVDADGFVLGVKQGTCTVTVEAPATTHFKSATKTCTVTVTDPSDAKTIGQLLALATGHLDNSSGSGDIALALSVAPTTVVAVYNQFVFVKDNTGVMLAYKSSPGVAVGDEVTMAGKLQNFYGIAEFYASEIKKTGNTNPVDHGTPTDFYESAISAFQTGARSVQYLKFAGILPTSKSGALYMNVGSKKVRIYNAAAIADADLGKAAAVFAYVYGYHSGEDCLQVIVTSYDTSVTGPFLSLAESAKTWKYNETNAVSFSVSVEAGGDWTFTSTGMDWATVTKSGNTLTVTPKSANSVAAPREGTVLLKNSADETKTGTLTFTQEGAPVGTLFYTLNGTMTGGSSGYDSASDITQASHSWKVMGNTTISPWRIGGKSLTNAERPVYNTTVFTENVCKVILTHGAVSGTTVNSVKLIVSKNSNFSSPVDTIEKTDFAANSDMTFLRPDGHSWDNCYFKIVYNITISATSNKYIQLSAVKLYK